MTDEIEVVAPAGWKPMSEDAREELREKVGGLSTSHFRLLFASVDRGRRLGLFEEGMELVDNFLEMEALCGKLLRRFLHALEHGRGHGDFIYLDRRGGVERRVTLLVGGDDDAG